jgi:hypothetical protein
VSTTTHTEIEDYLGRLRHELGDLPPDEVEEIVQDLEPQLAEIAEELGPELGAAALADRLGTPAEYARELRSAAGLGELAARRPSVWLPRTVLWVLVVGTVVAGYGGWLGARLVSNDARYVLPLFGLALMAAGVAVGGRRPATIEVAALPEVRLAVSLLTRTELSQQAVRYLTSLRPAWFLVRAGLVWLGLAWLFRWLGWWDAWPDVAALAFAVVTMVAGHRSVGDRRWLWLSVPLGGFAVGVAVQLSEMGEIWLPLITGDYIGY